ncbi:MAG TPA: ATP-binding protein [Anaerolineae bacterium]|nr:ATP-binding protein [Anaerolineae bacterium]HMR67257.1 ATP-binding protein [Anaerolineae bacterium]
MTIVSLTSEQLQTLNGQRISLFKSAQTELNSPFLQLVAGLDRNQRSQFITEQHYQPGQILFSEGEPGDSVFIIHSGRAAIIKGKFDAPTILSYRGAGDLVGEMALLENEPRSASVVVLEELRALRITHEGFDTLLNSNPALSREALGILSARLRASDNAIESLSSEEHDLVEQMSVLKTEKEKLLEREQLRQGTIDLVVHDLRHPISGIMGAIKILEMVLPEEILEANQQIINIANLNCDNLQLMVDSMLDIARMEAGDAQLYLSTIDLQLLIKDNLQRATLSTELDNITLEAQLGQLPLIRGDQEKLDRIVGNLLNNAIKYTPPHEKIIIEGTADDTTVTISVIDAGPGIPPEERERIFSRFTQLTKRHSGFGLGLAFCQLAVEAHGGKIWVESGNNGRGSRFSLCLPIKQPVEIDPEGIDSSE